MKKFLVFTTLFMTMVILGNTQGTAIGAIVWLDSGTPGGGGNPTVDGLKEAINAYDGDVSNTPKISSIINIDTIREYAKVNWLDNDKPHRWENSTFLDMQGNTTTGEWSLQSGDTTPIHFYALKKGTSHEFYWLNPFDTRGTWESNIGQEISNFRVYTATASQVPIPGAAWLLGSGMVGLLALRRRRIAAQ